MKINEVIDMVDGLVPNGISRETKVCWLNDCETSVHKDVFQTHHGTDCVEFCGYGAQTPPDTEMLLQPPHHQVYRYYLEMMIHEANQEIAKYNNAVAQYNASYMAMADDYNRRYMPKGRVNPKYW